MSETIQAFPCAFPAPGAARQFVDTTLAAWGHEDLIPDASLVVTELATNAIVHAKSDFVVRLADRPGGVRVAVSDHSPAWPAPQNPEVWATGGRGLLLVEAMSEQWGTRPEDDGKTVWAELVESHGHNGQNGHGRR